MPFRGLKSNPRRPHASARMRTGALALVLAAGLGWNPAVAQGEQRASNLWGAYLAGTHALEENDLHAAAGFMTQALRRSPGDTNLLQQAFALTVLADGVDEALVFADRIADINPRHELAAMVMLADALDRGDIEAARMLIDRTPETGLLQFALPFASAWTAAGEGSVDQAIRSLEALRDANGFEQITTIHTALILDYLDDPAAGAAYENVSGTTNTLALRAAAAHFTRAGEIDRALAFIDAAAGDGEVSGQLADLRAEVESGAVEARPIATPAQGVGEAFFQLASALAQEEAFELALNYARLSDHLRPGHPPTQLLIGEVMNEAGYTEASLIELAALAPDTQIGLVAGLRRARILMIEEAYDRALEVLDVLHTAWPDEPEPLIQRADALRVQEAFDEAVIAYDAASERLPALAEQDWSFLYRRGIALERSGEFERAEQDLIAAVRLNPDHAQLLNYLGYMWIDRGVNPAEAEELILRANDLLPDNGYIVDSVGWVYYRTGRLDQAVEWLERAVALRPNDTEINDHLGDAYWMTGRRLEARFQWRHALVNAEDADDIARIEGKLENGLDETGILVEPEAEAVTGN